MKKVFGIALVLALALVLSVGTVALADDPVEVTVTWGGGTFDSGGYPTNSGAGYIGATVTAGDDATTTFSTLGNAILGQFTAKDWNDASTMYFVDKFTTSFSADVTDGFATISTERTDHSSGWDEYGPPYMYGFAGEHSYNYVWASGGTAQLSVGSLSSYASMYTASGSLDANAANYRIESWFGEDGDPLNWIDNWAGLIAFGSGTANIDMGFSSASFHGGGTVTLGRGGGCYTNADAHFTGSGSFALDSIGSSEVIFHDLTQTGSTGSSGSWVGSLSAYGNGVKATGTGSYGTAALHLIHTFVSGFDYNDYSVTAK